MSTFNFEEWSNLYETDPNAFEIKREAALAQLVDRADQRNRLALEQTLFKVNMILRRAKSPLQSAMEASNLMWESFGKLREKLEQLEQMAQPTVTPTNSLRIVRSDPETNNVSIEDISVSTVVFDAVDKAELNSATVLRFPARKPN